MAALGLVHHRRRPLALHRLPPRPLLGRDRRRPARRRRRRDDHRRDRPDRSSAHSIGETGIETVSSRSRARCSGSPRSTRSASARKHERLAVEDPPSIGRARIAARGQPRRVPSQATPSLAPWRNRPPDPSRSSPSTTREARALIDGLGLAEPVAVTLVRRGYRTVEAARGLPRGGRRPRPVPVRGDGRGLRPAPGRDRAGRRITVHGDYDVDGVCSTAILVRALRALGRRLRLADPGPPRGRLRAHRGTVERLAERGTALLLTADCGIGSVDEVDAARAAGIEVIVTDHHQPGEQLPDCPILHPASRAIRSPSCARPASPTSSRRRCAGRGAAEADLDLVALATVADLVPLRGENRALVRRGLEVARRARRPGLRALLASASASRPSASTRATSPSGSGRGSTPPAGSTAPTPGSS